MSVGYQRKRLADFLAAARLARQGVERERWPRERLVAFQHEQLDALVRHAITHSPYYRERIGTVDGPVELGQLPVLDKATMMGRFDELVCDRRLRRDELLAHVEGLTGDPLYLDQYRVMTTSGSSGRKGVYAYDRREWSAYVAQFLRYSAFTGATPRLPRLRLAVLGGGSPTHATRRLAQTVDFGLHRLLSLPVTLPLSRLVDDLNTFKPQFLNSYPSIAVLLAEEQLAGRLRIAPGAMSTSSELRTPEMTARIEEAFGVTPFNLYGTTEGLWALDCEHHDGQHLFEDLTIVENVDDDGRPVADGQRGTKLLITNLVNRAQPLIRYELADSVTIDAEPCDCGRTLRRLRSIDGRSDDVIHLPGGNGARVAIHPLQFAVVARDRDVVEFQVVQEGPRLQVRVVARGDAAGLEARLRTAIDERLRQLGVADLHVDVVRRASLPRQSGGKLQLVVADRSVAAAG